MLARTNSRQQPRWIDLSARVTLTCFGLTVALVGPAGCGNNDSSVTTHHFDTAACQQGLKGEASASERGQEAGLQRIAWSVDSEKFGLDLRGDGEADLGRVEMSLIARDGEPVFRSHYQLANEEVASQLIRVRLLEEGKLFLRVEQQLDDKKAVLWVTLGSDYRVEQLTLGAPVEGQPPYPTSAQVDLEGAYETLEVVKDGQPMEASAVQAWIADHGLTAFDSDARWSRFARATNDRGWLVPADGRTRLCTAASLPTIEEGKKVFAQTEGCASESPIERFNNVSNILTWVEIGALVAMTAAAAGGLAVSGWVLVGIAGFIVLEKFVAPKVVEWYVSERREKVAENLSKAGGLLIDGEAKKNDAFVDFFGSSHGDPHLHTMDGLAYDLQTAGEFVLLRATDGAPFEIQTRQAPSATTTNLCPNVTFNMAVAARVGPARIGLYAGADRPLRVDGREVDLPGGLLALPGGGSVTLDSKTSYLVRWPGGEAMRVDVNRAHVNVAVGLPQSRRGKVEGLLGNFDGDTGDDLKSSDGSPLQQPIAWDTLVGSYADSWRISEATSLFDYESGQDSSTFVIDGFPSRPTTLEGLPADARASAESACADIDNSVAFADCVLDVACTGDPSYAADHEGRGPATRASLEAPIFLDTWQQEGDPGAGNWVVAADGRSVNQSVNGNPSFYVSPDDYFERVIRGTIHVGIGDDDIIGFVFGYQGPFSAEGDAEDEIYSWVLSWKGRTQGPALAGFTLNHVDGLVDTGGTGPFWYQQDAPNYRVVAQNLGTELGWVSLQEYQFELVYSAQRLIIRIDGAMIFDLTPTEAGVPAFESGRFGFYNFSQPNVDYANFSAAPLTN